MGLSTRLSLELDNERTGRPKPSRKTKFFGTNGGREKFIFPVQLTTSRIVNSILLIHFLLKVLTIQHAYLVLVHDKDLPISSRLSLTTICGVDAADS